MTLSSFVDSPIFFIIIILAFFGLIVLAVSLVKKYAKPFQNTEEKKSDEEIAKEELDRVLVDFEEDTKEKADAVEDGAPTEEEALDDAMHRTLGEIDDPEAIKAMEQWAKDHPEEAEQAEEGSEKGE